MSEDKKIVVMTPLGRLINNSLSEKDVYTDERGREATPSYKLEMAFDNSDEFEAFEAKIVEAAVAKWGEGAEDDYWDGKIRSPIQDGDKLAEAREKRGKAGDAYKGKLVLRAHTIYNRNGDDGPGGVYVCGPDAEELDAVQKGKLVYNGCRGQASVQVAPYDGIAGGQDGVTLYLQGFQYVEEGERLRSADPSSLFKPMMGEGSEDKGRKARGRGR